MEPLLRFTFDQVDIGNAFVGSTHSYEVILCNKGAINAAFSLVPPTTAVGSCFTFLPTEGIVSPHSLQVIKISFSSTILGKFTEKFKLRVNESPEPLTLTVRGCVVRSTFHFDVPSLHFGDVSFGFPHTLSCRLTNTSSVPKTVSLHIPGDGLGEPSVTSSALMADNNRPSWRRGAQGHIKPTEFTITPRKGIISPQGFLDIQVTLCSNTVKKYEFELVVDVEGVGKKVLALPLIARCVVPRLRVLKPALMFGHCFLKVPYQQMVTLVNDSNLPGCYRVLPQEHKEDAAVRYSSPKPCGIIQPRSSVKVPLILQAQVVGEHDTLARVEMFGNKGFPLKIHLVSIGKGPIVHIHPYKINFGRIQVLQDASRTLHLCNQTLAPASFRAEMAGKRSRWRIEPSRGVIPPHSKVSLAVIANLDDTKEFKDKVKVFIENSRSYVIPVQAVGFGTTVVIDKRTALELNLGPHFSLLPFCYRFKVTNKGRHTQLLYWTMEGFSVLPQRHHLPSLSNGKSGNFCQSPKSTCPVFKPRQPRMELLPGKSMEVVLEGFSNTPQVVKERLLCHTVVGSKAGKQLILQVDITCEIIDPALQVSSREVTSWVKKASDVKALQCKPLSLRRVSALLLSDVLSLEQPFLVCHAERQPLPADVQPVKLEVGEELHLSNKFNPTYEGGLTLCKVQKALNIIQILQHHHEGQVTTRGEDLFLDLPVQTTAAELGCFVYENQLVGYIKMTNHHALLMRYWRAFLADSTESQMRISPPIRHYFIKLQLPEVERAQLTSAESNSNNGAAEEPARARGAADNPLQEPTDADDTLKAKGYLGRAKEKVLQVCYMPGVPRVSYGTYQFQVGHLDPDKDSLKGEARFPKISLDLPRNVKGNDKYEKVLKEARVKTEQDNQGGKAAFSGEAVPAEPPTDGSETLMEKYLRQGARPKVRVCKIKDQETKDQTNKGKALALAPAGAAPTDTPRGSIDVEPSYVLDISVPTDVAMEEVKAEGVDTALLDISVPTDVAMEEVKAEGVDTALLDISVPTDVEMESVGTASLYSYLYCCRHD